MKRIGNTKKEPGDLSFLDLRKARQKAGELYWDGTLSRNLLTVSRRPSTWPKRAAPRPATCVERAGACSGRSGRGTEDRREKKDPALAA
jgi:hypothetical protein